VSLLLDALKRAESQKRRNKSAADLSGSMPDIDFSAIDPVALQRSGAKNLFNAKQSSYDGYSKAKLIAMLGGTALLLGAAGFYAWYWYHSAFPPGSQISLNQRALPPVEMRPTAAPAAAHSQPTSAPLAETPVPAQPTPVPASANATPLPGVKNDTQKPLPAAPAKTVTQNKPVVIAKPKPRVVAIAAPKPVASAGERTVNIPAVPAPPAPKQNSVSVAGSENNIQLRRSSEEIVAINPDLSAAYQALIAGRSVEARQKYEMVLQKDPSNIDAELGLATISAKNNDAADAARRYQRVLELNPKDAYALAGKAALVNDLPQTENQLRAQIAQQPQSAPLAAALGNIFAAQNRWNEAQQAYFDAARLDANNPDYAFNLAVSLDQINQPKLALENYQKALSLASVRPSQFSKDVVATRIAELSKLR
jgi:Tfp pilus assembly protein PilF